jgi:hypothetical protein
MLTPRRAPIFTASKSHNGTSAVGSAPSATTRIDLGLQLGDVLTLPPMLAMAMQSLLSLAADMLPH